MSFNAKQLTVSDDDHYEGKIHRNNSNQTRFSKTKKQPQFGPKINSASVAIYRAHF